MPFPINAILSPFTGSENPISEGGLWNTDSRLSPIAAQKVSGQLTGSGEDFWNAVYQTVFGPQVENYITIVSNIGEAFLLRIKLHNGSTSFNDYALYIDSANQWQIYKDVEGSATAISSLITQTVSNGDSIGLAYDSGNVIAYYKPAAGSWSAKITQADTTYQNVSGKNSIDSNTTGMIFDDFGGGTIGAGAPINLNLTPDRLDRRLVWP